MDWQKCSGIKRSYLITGVSLRNQDEVEYILQEIPPVAMVPMMWIIQKYFPLLVKN
ncbi:hypothetical protein [Shigella boydii]|uniref:hypothetical protein n=1 Tax=Shigella boydii TaxID=621 RepID=UPI00287B0022|nr:hypothetical protein [Shigella boydii]MDS1482465.1 hypothetical protein [Shigella boydii]